MKTVRPKPLVPDTRSLRLTAEEGFVLSRIDGRLTLRDLVALTGLEAARVEQIVEKLATSGAVALEAADTSGPLPDAISTARLPDAPSSGSLPQDDDKTSLAALASAVGMDPSSFVSADGILPAEERPQRQPAAPIESRSSYPPVALASDRPEGNETEAEAKAANDAAGTDDTPDESADDEEESADAANVEQRHRQLYETRFHALAADARIAYARKAHGPELAALCFDPDPKVIAAVLENATAGLEHARLIATHHRTQTGIEIVARRTEFLRDALVERRLLRNPQVGETVLGRIMSPKRILQTYKIAIDRDIPEISRVKTRGHLRQKWSSSPPEDRADLIQRTEARCLVLMTGCTFDARTTQILCGRPFNSVLFIQNLAKFTATPPNLLAHLMKQPFVRKNMPLKKLLLQHPNMPGDVKRSV